MKIEKLSENQIRCTLNKSDLVSRQLKISELAYGSEKAKELFRDMMQQASYELGFEADDIPIMIEAIPVSADCIVLIVTKVDDPEELDTRFSKFTPSTSDYSDTELDSSYDEFNSLRSLQSNPEGSNIPTAKDELNTMNEDSNDKKPSFEESMDLSTDVMNLFSKVKDYLNKSIASSETDLDINNQDDTDVKDIAPNEAKKPFIDDALRQGIEKDTDKSKATETSSALGSPFVPLKDSLSGHSKSTKKSEKHSEDKHSKTETVIRIFSFSSYDNFSEAAKAVSVIYTDRSSLYKDATHSKYYLTIERKRCSAVNFNKTCNILSEYGKKESLNGNSVNYFDEHLEIIIRNKAIQIATKI